ncbi:MAG TPA: 3-hydroxyacyl-CoA dehydrogenase family protein [Solirubrobacteraceae bacterium]|nr:3-hydroxyacyl-CoA dehydrogenase family protein [Solirubrobacteraceae bacterium]
MRVGVLGAGVMGRNIAKVLLRGGHQVALYSRTELTLLDAGGALEREAAAQIAYTTSIGEAAAGAELILESVPESLPLKVLVLREAESAAPAHAVIASNTSSLPLDRLAEALARPERFLGLHWFNPAHLIPLVEVVPTEQTDPAVVQRLDALMSELGKRPLVLSRAIEGFVANRLQYALIREALQLVQDGVASPEQIDLALTDCLGLRWAVLGPMRSTDLAGVPTAVAVARELFPVLSNAHEPQAPLTELLEAGRRGASTGEGFFSYPDAEAVAHTRDRLLSSVLGALAEAKS